MIGIKLVWVLESKQAKNTKNTAKNAIQDPHIIYQIHVSLIGIAPSAAPVIVTTIRLTGPARAKALPSAPFTLITTEYERNPAIIPTTDDSITIQLYHAPAISDIELV